MIVHTSDFHSQTSQQQQNNIYELRDPIQRSTIKVAFYPTKHYLHSGCLSFTPSERSTHTGKPWEHNHKKSRSPLGPRKI